MFVRILINQVVDFGEEGRHITVNCRPGFSLFFESIFTQT